MLEVKSSTATYKEHEMQDLKIERVTPSTRAAFLALSQNYEAEFSKITGKQPNHAGLYEITDEQRGHYEAWTCFVGQQIIGFAVVDISREKNDVAEFYIIPTHRKQKFGHQFASQLFDQYPGPWQVRQIMGAEYAREFWVAVIKQYSSDHFSNETEKDCEWGEVYIQKFTSRTKGNKQ
jgi:predicted acetyltransferase